MAYIEKEMQNHTVQFKVGKKPVNFTIWVNTDEETLTAAVINWTERTSKFTAQSLCDYINSKGAHKAMPA